MELRFMQVDESSPYFKTVYLPHKEKRLINAMYELACEGFICANYTMEIDKKQNDSVSTQQLWHRFIRNAYYDTAIRNWCMLFGSRNEPTHYSKLLTSEIFKERLGKINIGLTVDSLRKQVLKEANVTIEQHEKYHRTTKKYRDMYLIHRQHSPDVINDGDLDFPVLDLAIKFFYSYYAILIKLADTFENDFVTKYKFIYLSYTTKNKLESLIKKPIIEVLKLLKK